MTTVVINLFGAPCSGKSTAAAYIFAKLKMAGVNAELVTEYAKDMVYDGMTAGWNDQAYIFGNQLHRMERLRDKVDVIVTDSPLLLSLVYANEPELQNGFDEVVVNKFNSFANINFLLIPPSDAEFCNSGRVHTEDQSHEIQQRIKYLLEDLDVVYTPVNRGDIRSYNSIAECVYGI